jgi:eukaryotic-like serine/threonine-protein kinase
VTAVPERLAAALAERYRIERALGAGGMATVYLAEDLKHDRKVAIKVLKPELAAVLGADRFVQEIKTTAALQHPHILPLFDSGTAGGFEEGIETTLPGRGMPRPYLYYVMPYVEGETLREKLDRETQLGVEEAVRIATEVADALDYAHRHGVIHRDIKPENILLHDGRPMVMDFGIALALSAAAGGRMTETGMSLGTPHYMSPEQATADKDITARSDIYSLASVLYEMLTGEPPHMGNSAQQIIMKIIAEPVKVVTELRKSVPPNVASALAKALEKLPADRFATAREFAHALTDKTFSLGATVTVNAAKATLTHRSVATTGAVVALALALGVVLGWVAGHRPTAPPPLMRITVQADSTHVIGNQCCGPSLAISRDGQVLAFLAVGPSGYSVFVRRMEEFESKEIPGTEGASAPFLSPDGRWLGFLQDGVLKKVDLSGGAPQSIVRVGGWVLGVDWTDHDEIYFGNQSGGGIYRVSSEGGEPELVTSPDTSAGEAGRGLPRLLPSRRSMLFVTWNGEETGAADPAIHVLDLASHVSRRLVNGMQPYYVDTGYLVFVQPDGSVIAQRFDPGSATFSGDPIRITEDVILHIPNPEAEFVVSPTGSVAYRQGAGVQRTIDEFTMDGSLVATHVGPARRSAPRYSPDGRQVAYVQFRENSENSDIWVLDLASGIETRLSSGRRDRAPIWSADGRFVRWSHMIGSPFDSAVFMSRPADLSAPATPFGSGDVSGIFGLPAGPSDPIPFMHFSGGFVHDIWIVDADGSNPRPWRESQYEDLLPALSPSGKWIAFESDQSGGAEVYVQPFPAGGAVTRVSPNGGRSPVWASNGRLLYRGSGYSSELRYVDLDMSGPRPQPTANGVITGAVELNQAVYGHNYAASPGGSRVAVLRESGSSTLMVEMNRLQHLSQVSR